MHLSVIIIHVTGNNLEDTNASSYCFNFLPSGSNEAQKEASWTIKLLSEPKSISIAHYSHRWRLNLFRLFTNTLSDTVHFSSKTHMLCNLSYAVWKPHVNKSCILATAAIYTGSDWQMDSCYWWWDVFTVQPVYTWAQLDSKAFAGLSKSMQTLRYFRKCLFPSQMTVHNSQTSTAGVSLA